MTFSRIGFLAFFPAFALACSAPANPVESNGSAEGNLDTSGCSGEDSVSTRGPVSVDATRPPTASCWNVADSGLAVTYNWTQTNDATPEKTNVGFYVALNDSSTYVKADSYDCQEQSGGGYGVDTSGARYYACTASKAITFGSAPKLLDGAYDASGHRGAWNVQIAVSLDDNGNWDSLNGANYRFSF